jgi:hypothetical protein
MLRIPHCLDNRLTDGGEAVSLRRRRIKHVCRKYRLRGRMNCVFPSIIMGTFSLKWIYNTLKFMQHVNLLWVTRATRSRCSQGRVPYNRLLRKLEDSNELLYYAASTCSLYRCIAVSPFAEEKKGPSKILSCHPRVSKHGLQQDSELEDRIFFFSSALPTRQQFWEYDKCNTTRNTWCALHKMCSISFIRF